MERRLVAILAADVVGYSRLMGDDEEATLTTLNACREVIDGLVADHRGRVFGSAGDSVIAEFASPVEAVRCAFEMQKALEGRNADLLEDRRMRFRIGVNLGDVMVEGDNLYGDGVNVAARLESLAEPGGICVSDMVYQSVEAKVDLVFDDLGDQEVKNIAKPVRAYRVVVEPSPGTVTAPGPQLRRSPGTDKPTIAVLQFDNMSGDPEQEYFANGITEDIITALTKNRWLSVISRNSTFAYKGQSLDVRRVANELGATYVVKGSVRKAVSRVRITVQLIDANSGNHIWAERYDRDLEDIFAVQDEITETIAGTIEPELATAESQRVKRKPTENLGAWDCYHLALSHMYKFNKDDNVEAQRLFRRATELDPDFGGAYARLAYAIIASMVYFDAEPIAETLDEALRVARRAAALDNQDAVAHFAVGRVHLARSEYDLAVAELETAVELNPSLAQAHCGLGDSLAYAGRLEESIPHFAEAIRLSPRDPYRWGFLMYRSIAHLLLKQYEEAAKWAKEAVRVPNSWFWANAHLVAAVGYLDQSDETRAALKELLRRKPEFTVGFARNHLFYIKDSTQIEQYLDGLRKAGVPEK